jgi:hypothetical protein
LTDVRESIRGFKALVFSLGRIRPWVPYSLEVTPLKPIFKEYGGS